MRLGTFLLQRPITGQGLGGETLTSDRVAARAGAGVAPIVVALHTIVSMERAEDRARDSRRQVEVGPVAPLLIRLVQNPYELSVTRPRRTQAWEPIDRSRAARSPSENPVADCRSLRSRPRSGLQRLPRAAALPKPRRYPEDP